MSIKTRWNRFKKWVAAGVLAVLAAVGIHHNADSQVTPVTDNISWTMPTSNTDGSALPLSSIAKTTIVWGTAPGGPYTAGSVDVTAPATTAALLRPGNGFGTRCYKLNVTTTPAAGSVAGLFANEVCKTVVAPPNPPTNVQVN